MKAEKILPASVKQAVEALDRVGSRNSPLMATRAIHINVLVHDIPGPLARFLKCVYNEVGAEAGISHEAYYEVEGAVTDMIAMGTVYQHREVRRVLAGHVEAAPVLDAIRAVVENAPESRA
ncbi:MAG: hypothetical protein V2B18_19745 [Pseudomonadota bacterium]